MRLKFFTLAINTLLLLSSSLSGQSETPVSKVGYLRFWDMMPAQNGGFEVRRLSGPGSEQTLASGTAYRYTSYRDIAVGRYKVAVQKSGTNSPLKIFDFDVKPNSYFTVLVSPQSIEIFDDTIDPKATSGTLIIRNYFNGAVVDVASGSQRIIDNLGYGQMYVASGLPVARLPLSLRARIGKNTPIEAGAEADLLASKHATVLIMPDSYGRLCARAAIDGKNP